MNGSPDRYTILARLFSYPDADFPRTAREVQEYLDDTCAEAADELRPFTEFSAGATLIELEELYTRSFDVQAVTTIDLGYVLFGDDYKRGQLLVNLNSEHHEAGIDCGTELPDHLPNVLRLIDRMQNTELRDELVQEIIAPALRKIIGEFDPHRLKAKNAVYMKHHKTLIERSERYSVIYEQTLRALYSVLECDFDIDITEAAPVPHQSRFLKSIGTELSMESNKGNSHVSHK